MIPHYETIIYATLTGILFAWRVMLSKQSNALVYQMQREVSFYKSQLLIKKEGVEIKPFEGDPIINKELSNIHRVETKESLTQYGLYFFIILCVFRLLRPDINYFIQAGLSLVQMFLYSSLLGFVAQGYVNLANGRPFIDRGEPKKGHFLSFGLDFHYPKFWHGYNRVYISFFSLVFSPAPLLIQLKIITLL